MSLHHIFYKCEGYDWLLVGNLNCIALNNSRNKVDFVSNYVNFVSDEVDFVNDEVNFVRVGVNFFCVKVDFSRVGVNFFGVEVDFLDCRCCDNTIIINCKLFIINFLLEQKVTKIQDSK